MNHSLLTYLLAAFVLALYGCESKDAPVQEDGMGITDWNQFHYPIVDFRIDEPNGQAKDFALYVPDLEALIKKEALRVSKLLYEYPNEVPRVDSIIYTVCEFDGLSGKGGKRPTIEFVFGSQYFASMLDSTLTKQEIRDEIIGVMVHEMTHAYQMDCKYEGDGWSVIEGIADAVRYLEGYVDISRRKTGGSWKNGYKTTGFFMVWIMEHKDKDFLKKLNRSLGEHYDWQWNENMLGLTGQSVESLWLEYQNHLQAKQVPIPDS